MQFIQPLADKLDLIAIAHAGNVDDGVSVEVVPGFASVRTILMSLKWALNARSTIRSSTGFRVIPASYDGHRLADRWAAKR